MSIISQRLLRSPLATRSIVDGGFKNNARNMTILSKESGEIHKGEVCQDPQKTDFSIEHGMFRQCSVKYIVAFR